MARARYSHNPAKVKAQVRALERESSPPPPRGRKLLRRLTKVLLCALTVALLSVCFAPFDAWVCGYVALAPWVLVLAAGGPACLRQVGGRRRDAALWALLTGGAFWAINLYWLSWVTMPGYAAAVFYVTLYWLVAGLLLRSAAERGWPLWIVLPVVWVALEYVRAHVIGFPWFYLAHGQYTRTRLIQVADLTGQYGVSFFVAMVNGAVADVAVWLVWSRGRGTAGRARRHAAAGLAGCVLAAGGLLGYGSWRLGQETTSPGPVLGLVQEAFPISLHSRGASEEKILSSHLRLSEGLVGSGAELVIWPETMLPMFSNAEFLDMDVSTIPVEAVEVLARRFGPENRAAYRNKLRLLLGDVQAERRGADPTKGVRRVDRLVGRLGCPILAGGLTIHLNPQPLDDEDRWLRKNSVLAYTGGVHGPGPGRLTVIGPADRPVAGIASGGTGYSKVQLVPFSEYVPFKRSWPWFHRRLRWFVPAVMEQLEPGSALTRFRLTRIGDKGPEKSWDLATPICYEGTFARVCRRMVVRDGRKRVDILANLSNDGWFVWGRRGSTEHAQHLAGYCFRAVENRVPVVRAVNTGISASIDSNGRIVATLQEYGLRTMVAGALLLDGGSAGGGQAVRHGPVVLVDSRLSVYSRFGDVFARIVGAAGLGLAGWLSLRRPRRREGGENR